MEKNLSFKSMRNLTSTQILQSYAIKDENFPVWSWDCNQNSNTINHRINAQPMINYDLFVV